MRQFNRAQEQPKSTDRDPEKESCHIVNASSELTPGMFVRHPQAPDWGLGQVQSAVGHRVTVTFEHAGKQLINTALVTLAIVDSTDLDVAPPETKDEYGQRLKM